MTVINAEPIGTACCELGESPVWYGNQLSWVDIPSGILHTASIKGGKLGLVRTLVVPGSPLGAAVPWARGGWLCAVGTGFTHLGATITHLAQPEAGNHARFNDGKCDPAGRFWAGSNHQPDGGSLYRVDLDGTVRRILTGIGISNGLGWHGTRMYYADSHPGTLSVLDYDQETGVVENRRVILTFDKPIDPDGLAIDGDGGIWVALWNGSAVHRYTPEGLLDTVVRLPVRRPTSCCFAGDTLIITTARDETLDEPLGGAVFACQPGARAEPATPFRGTLPHALPGR